MVSSLHSKSWTAHAVIPTDSSQCVEYKFVAKTLEGEIIWEVGANRTIDFAGVGSTTHVQGQWRGAN